MPLQVRASPNQYCIIKQTTVNIPCFAPTMEAAQLEGSKVFAKDFTARHGIPTAEQFILTSIQNIKV